MAGDLVDLCMPLQWNFHAPLVVEVVGGRPEPDLDGWEHVVEFALRVPSGRLVLEGSGGSGELWPSAAAPAAVELKRWPGCDFHVGPQE
jgi:hypothetical protein